VGGGFAAVKIPAAPSMHHKPPPCKRHDHVDVLQAFGLHPPHQQESDKRSIAVPHATKSPVPWLCHGPHAQPVPWAAAPPP